MSVTVYSNLVPIGVGPSLSVQVTGCERVLAEAGLPSRLHANCTKLAGDQDAAGAPRFSLLSKVDPRGDRLQTPGNKFARPQLKLDDRP